MIGTTHDVYLQYVTSSGVACEVSLDESRAKS